MPDEWSPAPDPYVDATDPIALSPGTYARHARVVNRVLGDNQARYPYPRRGRTTNPNAGIWAKLASGDTITAASGLTLGSGTVALCTRSGSTLTATSETVTVYNGGPAITASSGDKAMLLHWSDGVWSASNCN